MGIAFNFMTKLCDFNPSICLAQTIHVCQINHYNSKCCSIALNHYFLYSNFSDIQNRAGIHETLHGHQCPQLETPPSFEIQGGSSILLKFPHLKSFEELLVEVNEEWYMDIPWNKTLECQCLRTGKTCRMQFSRRLRFLQVI